MSRTSVYFMERKLTKVLAKMERRGIRIDPDYCQDALCWELEHVAKIEAEFKALTRHEFKDSNKLFKEIFEANGDEYPVTAKGNPSFNADSLAAIDTPTARLIKQHRNHTKRAGTYYSSFLHYADNDNLIHASANQAGTVTGRMSYSNPNLQNIPKEDEASDKEKKYVVRGAFIPGPGNVFVAIDYDQMEYRVMLDYAGEHGLIKQVNGGLDVHTAAGELLGLPRSQAKTLSFGLLYGMGTEALANALKLPFIEARDLKRHYFLKLPMVKSLIKGVVSTGEARGHIYNWLGRESRINGYDESYKLPNHLIQGSCADIVKTAMVRIDEEFPDIGMLVQVHDELLFDMREEDLAHVPRIKQIMEQVYKPKNGMYLTAGVEYSRKSWAYRDLEEYEFSQGK